jgi:hypothetical protein
MGVMQMVRIQLRRDTAANWTSSNPVLRAGEVGIETDTLKFKVGNGTSTWTQITGYANITPSSLTSSLAAYIESGDLGQPSGPAQLTGTGDLLVPGDEIVMVSSEDSLYTTTLAAVTPTAFRTINFPNSSGTVALTSQIPTQYTDELAQDAAAAALAAGTHTNITVTYNDNANSISLAAAPGYVDEQAVDAVAAALAAGTHTNITVGYNDAGNAISLTGAVTYTDENAQDAVGNAVGTGLSYNDSTGAISVDTSTIQARVTDVSDTEIGYLNGVTSAIQTQLNDKLASATASTTYAPIASPTFTGTVTVPAPLNNTDAATKAYVDAATAGLNVHASAKAATTANVSLNNNLEAGDILDGVTLAHNDRVLVKNQDAPSENGIYIVQPNGAATRATDYDSTPEVDAGDFIFVEGGTVNAKTGWIQTNLVTTIGTDAIAFSQFSGAGTYLAGNGLTLTGNSFSINTGTTADLSTAQTLTNKTINANANTITVTSANVSDFNEASQDAVGNAVGTGLTYTDSTGAISVDTTTIQARVADVSDTEIGYLNGVTSAIQTQLNGKTSYSAPTIGSTPIASGDTISQIDELTLFDPEILISTGTSGSSTVSGTSTQWSGTGNPLAVVADLSSVPIGATLTVSNGLTGESTVFTTTSVWSSGTINVTRVSGSTSIDAGFAEYPDMSSNVVASWTPTYNTISSVELKYLDGITSNVQTQLDSKIAKSLFDTKGDILVASADNTPAKLAAGTNGYLLTANSSATNGVEWAAAPVSLPSQTGENGKYLTTDGTNASWGTLVVPISTGTVTVNQNTAQDVDTTALSAFTSIEYMISIKQGSKVRTSKVIMQTDGTSVDMTEFAITETGGTIAGVVVSATTASSNGKLQVTVTDALSTNATVKLSKVAL